MRGFWRGNASCRDGHLVGISFRVHSAVWLRDAIFRKKFGTGLKTPVRLAYKKVSVIKPWVEEFSCVIHGEKTSGENFSLSLRGEYFTISFQLILR